MAIGKPYAVRISRVSSAKIDRGYYINFGDNFNSNVYKPKYVQVVPQGKDAITLVFYQDKKCKNDGRWLIDQNKKRTKVAYMDNLENFIGEYANCPFGMKMEDGGMVFRIFSSDRSVFTHLYAKRSGQTIEVEPVKVKKPEEPGPDIFEQCLKGDVRENNVVEEKKEPDDHVVRTSFGLYTEAMFNGKFIRPLERKIDELDAEIARLQTLKVKYRNAIDVINELFKDEVVKP